jgi:hypothetical protein
LRRVLALSDGAPARGARHLNAGDELLVQFDGRGLAPPPAGWVRDFFLLTDGWTKDANINTLTSQRVEPLPFHGMKHYPPAGGQRCPDTAEHRRYRRDYNTRYVTQRPFLEAIRGPHGRSAPGTEREARSTKLK